jgi:hypothetical protein
MSIKYNCTLYEQDGRTYHFVTKRAAFTSLQMGTIAADIARKESEALKGERVHRFKLPVRNIFLSDIKLGAKHCVAKYNVPIDDIVAEAELEFQGSDIRKWLGVK